MYRPRPKAEQMMQNKIFQMISTRKHKQEFILAVFIFIYIFYFTIASFLRYDNFYTGRFDLGNMDQTVWNTINGRIFQTSSDVGSIISRLSTHADFILVFLSPFYLLWSHPKMLLLIQTLVLATGGIFVFLIAKEILKNKNLSLIFGILYLFNPSLQYTNLYDFHAVTLATTFLLATFYFLIKNNYFFLTIFLILSGLAKEQIWAICGLIGGYVFFREKNIFHKKLGAIIFLFSFLIFYLLIWHVIPSFRGNEHFALAYYSEFGNSPTEVIKNLIFSPIKTISILLSENQLSYLWQLFSPLGLFSLLSPLYLIFALPDLLINLLSSNHQLHQIYYQYSATITPFIFISAIFGIKKFMQIFPKIPIIAYCIYLIVISLFSSYSFGPLPGAKKPNIDMFTKPQKNKWEIEKFLLTIPKNNTVAATNNLGSHLSQRQIIYTIPIGIDKADFVLFLGGKRDIINKVQQNKEYYEILKIDDFVVFKKQEILL